MFKLNRYFRRRRSANTWYEQSSRCPARNSCLWLLGAARLCLFDVRVCYPKSQSYRGFTTKQIYHRHESENKRMNANRVLEVEQGSCRPLVFPTTGGMTDECKRYHSRLAKLLSTKKGEDYSTTFS